ncbi:MAG: hypothetical protein JWO82_2784 [Akkermansiaceae bacterium]|nr:hypothetical protein [Akkermansiaceae bacterium]
MSEKPTYPRSSSDGLLTAFFGGGLPAALLFSGLLIGAAAGSLFYRPGPRVIVSESPPKPVVAVAAVVPVPVIQELLTAKLDWPAPDATDRPAHRGGLLDQAAKVEDFARKYDQHPDHLGLTELRAVTSSSVAQGAATEAVIMHAAADAKGTTLGLSRAGLEKGDTPLAGISLTCWSVAQPEAAMQWALNSEDPRMVGYAAVCYRKAKKESVVKLLPKLSMPQLEAFIEPLCWIKPPISIEESWQFVDAIQALPQPLSKALDFDRSYFLGRAAEDDPERVEAFVSKTSDPVKLRSWLLPSIALGHGKHKWEAANEWLQEQQSNDLRGPLMLLWRRWATEDRPSFERAADTAPASQKVAMQRLLGVMSRESPVREGK